MRTRVQWLCVLVLAVNLAITPSGSGYPAPAAAQTGAAQAANPATASTSGPVPVLWCDPGDIASRDLVYGIGGKDHAPPENGKYKFEKEDENGTSTKFYVEDQNGVRWLVKVGEEALPETAATRFVWAVGYFADQDYYLPQLHVSDMPHLRRGNSHVLADGTVNGARLKRQDKSEKKVGNWAWTSNPFVHTRELNGLLVMMALIDNWDLKTENNKIFDEDHTELRYEVSDVGASFGKTGDVVSRSKGKVEDYRKSRFIEHADKDYVDFVMKSGTFPLFVPVVAPIQPKNFEMRRKIEDLTKHIPRADAKWIGQQLSRLTPQQVSDAFRTAGFSPEEVEGYTRAMLDRIAQLNAL